MRRPARDAFRAGFTLVEVLLVLALMALVSGVLILGSASLMSGGKDDPEAVILDALQRARREAVERNETVELRIEDDGSTLSWGETSDQSVTVPNSELMRARLLAPVSLGAVLIGGEAEERPLANLRLHPDGTCDHARLEVRRNGARRLHVIDPMTCAPLAAEDI
ncbi:MAG: GspH/FimT family pseudopilin [Opitutales bacterium]